MELETILAIVTALGLRELGGAAVAAWTRQRGDRRDDFRANIDAFRGRAEAAEQRAERAEKKADRANRRLDLMWQAIHSCPWGARCPVLSIDEVDEDAPVDAGK